LQKQLLNKNSEIERKWIYQGAGDKIVSETDIYLEAREIGAIDDSIYDQLMKLYKDRNRVVHRFIISEITLADVEEIAYQYYLMQQKIVEMVRTIEAKQIGLGIGMTKTSDSSDSSHNGLEDFAAGKFGKIDYFEKK
jgi:hypothetical protein